MRILITVLGVALLCARPASASFIDFTALNIGPSATIVLDGLTITGQNGALAAIVAGEGLGIANIGRMSAIDAILAFEAGHIANNLWREVEGRLQLSVDGVIDSLTLQPFMTILSGQTALGFPNFEIRYFPHTTGLASTDTQGIATPFVSKTLAFTDEERPHTISDMGLWLNQPPESRLTGFVNTYGPEITVQFGYSIVSMNYTPTSVPDLASFNSSAVPEPATGLLLGLGALALWRRRR